MTERTARARGFTLIELLVTVVILGILATIAFATYQSTIAGVEDSTIERSAESFDRQMRSLALLDIDRAGGPVLDDWVTMAEVEDLDPQLAVGYDEDEDTWYVGRIADDENDVVASVQFSDGAAAAAEIEIADDVPLGDIIRDGGQPDKQALTDGDGETLPERAVFEDTADGDGAGNYEHILNPQP